MTVILSNGYKLPETGDFGNIWFTALEDNITRVNSHNHDGVNSEKISSVNITATTATIASGSFAASGNRFVASATVPSGQTIDTTQISFRDPTTKESIYLEIEKTSSTQYNVYTHIVQDFEVVYS